jgi:hypothetical protein
MTQQPGDRAENAPRLGYESPKEPVGRHGSFLYTRDADGGLTVTGPHSDSLEHWPRVKRTMAIALGAGMLMAMIGASAGGVTINLSPGSFGVRGNILARAGVYVTAVSAVVLTIVWLIARTKRARVTIEANRDGLTYRVQPPEGPEQAEQWNIDEIAGVGAGFDNALAVALRDGRHVRLYLGRHYAEWMQLAEEVNRALGRPMAQLAPGEKQRMGWG